jgi:hypothetical protein
MRLLVFPNGIAYIGQTNAEFIPSGKGQQFHRLADGKLASVSTADRLWENGTLVPTPSAPQLTKGGKERSRAPKSPGKQSCTHAAAAFKALNTARAALGPTRLHPFSNTHVIHRQLGMINWPAKASAASSNSYNGKCSQEPTFQLLPGRIRC